MIFGCSRFACFLALAGLVLVAARSATAQQPPSKRGRAIEFSEPRSDVVSSNVNELGDKKTTLKSLEQDLKKPFEVFSPIDDSGGRFTMTPQQRIPPSAAKARRMKELLEKRNEWIFLAPEDYYAPGLTAEEMLGVPEYGPNGEVKKLKTPLERYFERMEKRHADTQAATTNQARADAEADQRQADEKSEGFKDPSVGGSQIPLSSGLSDLEKTAKSLSPADFSPFATSGSEQAGSRSFSELFGFGKTESAEATADKSRALEARMQEFKQLMEVRSLTPPNSGMGAFNSMLNPPGAAPPAGLPGGLDSFSSPGSRGAFNPFTPAASAPAQLPGLATGAGSLGSPSWPAPEPPRMTLTAPTFNIPQRKF